MLLFESRISIAQSKFNISELYRHPSALNHIPPNNPPKPNGQKEPSNLIQNNQCTSKIIFCVLKKYLQSFSIEEYPRINERIRFLSIWFVIKYLDFFKEIRRRF